MTIQTLTIQQAEEELAVLAVEVPYIHTLLQNTPCTCGEVCAAPGTLHDELMDLYDKKSTRKARLEAALTAAMANLPLVNIDVE